jgi:hypothetical protein
MTAGGTPSKLNALADLHPTPLHWLSWLLMMTSSFSWQIPDAAIARLPSLP